ncbi:hypothetical protein [Dyadobacter bucti]|uniref:hypothetical protein n=1 Tax=Dyadobacter bucti TaxID=2572203 RepID=UPI0011099038|nr:hypothetical protein [Dyadobacter bucti]
MMNVKELASVYDTIMSILGMNDQIKIDLKISRRNVLLLTQAIKRALNVPGVEGNPDLIEIASNESKEELLALSADCLEKSGLVELNDRLAKL